MFLARRILYWLYRLASALRYRAPRRFTRAGLGLLSGLLVTGVLSLNVAGSLAYQLFVLQASFLLIAVFTARFHRFRYSAERVLPRFGTVGCPLNYSVILQTGQPQSQADLVLLENLEDPRPRFAEYAALRRAEEGQTRSFTVTRRGRAWSFELAHIPEAPVAMLVPGQPAEVRLELTPLRRGCIRFSGLTLARPDPLGLVRGFARLPRPQSLLVLPKRYPVPPVALPGIRKYQQGGVALAASVGESEEFVSLREYRQGDPLRHIHWRSWAKAGRPITKEFQDEFFVRHALILDTFADHPQSDVFEEAVSVAASFACTIQTQESLLDLLFVGAEAYCFTSGRGVAHTEQMLEILASVRTCQEKQLIDLERLVLNHIGAVSGCICVLIAWDDARRQLVKRLRDLNVPLLVLVVTGSGAHTHLDPGPLKDQPWTFRVIELGKVEEELARL